ncbi:chemotaxis protein CheD [Falsihalocynthiibacter sp. SS001]|uniref:chemotaxis protein CheD n=1 Tax=Falsihalocynthiibacter sp. SS001 TaxID=3349698 RepID=UPI0036D313F8
MNAVNSIEAFVKSVHIAQGEYFVSNKTDVLISTVLGSCVATCLWDARAGVGGMNHILLPQDLSNSPMSQMHGINAMEILINEMLKLGAVKSRIRAKLFGGAKMVVGLSNIGLRNSRFAADFLRQEQIPCEAQSLGGVEARRIQFWPSTGRARQKFVTNAPVETPIVGEQANDVELF